MKKVFSVLMAAVLAVVSFSSCQEQALDVKDANSVHFVVKASIPQTKTYIDNQLDGTYNVGWNSEDQLAVFFSAISKGLNDEAEYIFENTEDDGPTAVFEGDVTVSDDEGEFLSFYPASALAKTYDGTVGVTLKEIQKPTYDSFDPSCDILVAKPCYYLRDEDGSVVIDNLYFKRMLSVLKVNLNSSFADVQGEAVTNFKLTAPADVVLSGRPAIDLENAEIKQWNIKNSYVAAELSDVKVGTELENSVYLVVNPTTIPSGSAVIFTIETENYIISKEVTLSKDLSFPQGNIAVINLNIVEANCEEKSDEVVAGTDVLTRETTGVADKAGYSNWSKVKVSTSAVYAGNTAGANNAIQLRSDNSNSGIVSTASAGVVTNVAVEWEGHTANGRTLDIYGSNTPYSAATDLYSSITQGTKIGSIVYGSSTSYAITGTYYKYIGLRSKSGSMYLSKISITWGEEPEAVAVSGVSLNHTELTMVVGAEETLTPTITPENATNKEVSWTSDNTAVATVNNAGKVTAVAAGSAHITVTTADGGFNATCNVTVNAAPVKYNVVIPTGLVGGTISADPVEAPAGATVTLTATPASGYQFVSWSVKDESNNDITVTNNAFTMPASDVTVNATFEQSEGGQGDETKTETLTASEITAKFTNDKMAYATGETYVDGDITWDAFAFADANNRPWMQLKKDKGVYVKITAPSAISEVRLTITSASNSSGGSTDITKHTAFSGTARLKSADAAGDGATNDICASTEVTNNTMVLSIPDSTYKVVYVKVSTGARIWGIEVDY